ncbi:marvel domain-containing protein [Podospora didyma]|uniref:Marvel domain-containing protein n=1 Tax=Podospora didyma TaxID=330526 RepID=A0AAE0P0Q7_9PEZI|nr:marvel domain-containing protein [Podospora didyma]
MLSAITLGVRALQFIFAIVVLGLSITLIKAQQIGDAPTTTKYSSFTGGFGILVCAAGVLGLFISKIPDIAFLALDGILGILFLAGGIAWAIGLKGINCKSIDDLGKMLDSPLINQGCTDLPDGRYCPIGNTGSTQERIDRLQASCQKGFTNEIFQFLCVAISLGVIGLGYVRMRKGGSSGGNYVV